MRLALIGPSRPFRGGIAQFHDGLAAALDALGHDVSRISFRRLYPRLLFPGRTELEPTASPSAPSDRLAPPAPILDAVLPWTWRRALRAATGVDAAVVEWWHPFFAPALGGIAGALRRRRIPTVFVCHNVEPHEPMPGGAALARYACGRAAAFLTLARASGARLEAAWPGRPVRVVAPPVLLPFAADHSHDRVACARALGLPDAARRVLFFGYVRAYKGLPTLVEAMGALDPPAQLVVAGEIYHRDAAFYRALAGAHGVADRLVLLDRFLTTAESACCFGAADVVALPYWEASQSGVAPLAMACGRPVVASDVGGLPELVVPGETGLLVPPRNAGALAAALATALDAAPAWGPASRVRARHFGFGPVADAVVELAREALAAPRGDC